MKKYLLLVLLLVPGTLYGRNGNAGAGIIIGSPTGVSGKYWLNSRNAFDAAFSVVSRDEVYLHVNYLWHDYRAFPKPEEGRLPFYYGAGPVISGGDLGLRGSFGIEYIFDGYPFDIFLELAPVLTITPDVNFRINGGIGGRYFWR